MNVTTIPLEKLVPHPDSPNRMSKTNFAKLVRNIERTGLYEPLVVRPDPKKKGRFQILNGHRRFDALKQLGFESALAVVWEIDDRQADVALTTLNRLVGRDMLDKKLRLLRRLTRREKKSDLSRLLPYSVTQLERLTSTSPIKIRAKSASDPFAIPLVFYVDADQQCVIDEALAQVEPDNAKGRSARRADALTRIATRFYPSLSSIDWLLCRHCAAADYFVSPS